MIYDGANPIDAKRSRCRIEHLVRSGVKFEIIEKKPIRSCSQNRYLHLLISMFAIEYGISADEAKIDFYKRRYNADTFIINGKNGKKLRSASTLTAQELTTTIDRFKTLASVELGIYLPDATDYEYLAFIESEIKKHKEYI